MKKNVKRFVVTLSAALCLGLFGSAETRAQSVDVFEHAYPSLVGQVQCNGQAAVIFATLDVADDTLVTITVAKGNGGVINATGSGNVYAFSYTECGKTAAMPSGPGQVAIRFVDAKAPGFAWSNPTTWVYKRARSVSVEGSWDGQIARTDPVTGTYPPNPYFRIQAYKEFSQVGEVTGTTSAVNSRTKYSFADAATGIKELYIHTDFTENELNNLFISNSAPLSIVTEPAELTVMSGQKAALSVVAQGSGTLQYQWYKNRRPVSDESFKAVPALCRLRPILQRPTPGSVSGSTSAQLTIENARVADSGIYSVRVKDQTGAVSSKQVRLTVKCRL